MNKTPIVKLNRNRLLKKWLTYDFSGLSEGDPHGRRGDYIYHIPIREEDGNAILASYREETKTGFVYQDEEDRHIVIQNNKGEKLCDALVGNLRYWSKDKSEGFELTAVINA